LSPINPCLHIADGDQQAVCLGCQTCVTIGDGGRRTEALLLRLRHGFVFPARPFQFSPLPALVCPSFIDLGLQIAGAVEDAFGACACEDQQTTEDDD
jgi:hypothetical protein